jgi:hypothetical protein
MTSHVEPVGADTYRVELDGREHTVKASQALVAQLGGGAGAGVVIGEAVRMFERLTDLPETVDLEALLRLHPEQAADLRTRFEGTVG